MFCPGALAAVRRCALCRGTRARGIDATNGLGHDGCLPQPALDARILCPRRAPRRPGDGEPIQVQVGASTWSVEPVRLQSSDAVLEIVRLPGTEVQEAHVEPDATLVLRFPGERTFRAPADPAYESG